MTDILNKLIVDFPYRWPFTYICRHVWNIDMSSLVDVDEKFTSTQF